MDMGFARDSCEAVLVATGGDEDQAVNMLLSA